jgi:hypothetical protein
MSAVAYPLQGLGGSELHEGLLNDFPDNELKFTSICYPQMGRGESLGA